MTDFQDRIQSSLGPAYTILRELGAGGMSRVFLAREGALGRDVVIKVVSPDMAHTMSAERFAREIRLAASLQEPHIVPLLAAGKTSDGLPYYTMPFVRGESLRSRLGSGPLSRAEALGILRDIARALDYAHGNGVVHRDIKPENVLLSSGTAMVTDFGIAKAIRAAREDSRHTHPGDPTLGTTTSVLTSLGLSLGTPAYMSPEQGVGVDEVDHRADLYSWGVVAWELLAGRHPFSNRTTAQSLVAAHVSEPAPPLSSATSGVPTALARLVMRCLEKDPANRPQHAAELLAVLAQPGVPAFSGHRRVAGIAGTFLIVGAAAVGVWMWDRTSGDTPVAAQSVGVTTFVNLGADPNNEYFSEGVTQEIADALGRVPGLRVAVKRPGGEAAPSGAEADARMVGRAMRVGTVLMGSVQRAGDRVRVTARLVNTEDGFQIWTDKFDREVADVFALQDDVARAIVGSLKLTLAPAVRDSLVRVVTTDPEAHNLYLQGMYFWNRRGSQNIRKSMTYFQRALERDPGFARAWAGLALAYAIVITWEDVDVPTTLDLAFGAARRALALDSTTSEAWTAIAEAKKALWKNSEATVAYEKAIALDPNNATAHQWYAEHLAHLGRFDEARARIHIAQQLAPLSLVVNTQEGRIELQARRFAQAKQALDYVLELDSTYRTAHTLIGAVHLQQREFDKAIASFHRAIAFSATRRTMDLSFLAHAYATAGRAGEAREMLAELEQRRTSGGTVSYAGLALVYQSLGAGDRALAFLDTAVSKYDALVQMHGHEAIFDPFRASPRGAAILARSEELTPAK